MIVTDTEHILALNKLVAAQAEHLRLMAVHVAEVRREVKELHDELVTTRAYLDLKAALLASLAGRVQVLEDKS